MNWSESIFKLLYSFFKILLFPWTIYWPILFLNRAFLSFISNSMIISKYFFCHFIQSLMHIFNLVFDILRVFFLSIWITLQEFHKSTYICNFLFLSTNLRLYLFYSFWKTLSRQTSSTDSFKLNFQECHICISISH